MPPIQALILNSQNINNSHLHSNNWWMFTFHPMEPLHIFCAFWYRIFYTGLSYICDQIRCHYRGNDGMNKSEHKPSGCVMAFISKVCPFIDNDKIGYNLGYITCKCRKNPADIKCLHTVQAMWPVCIFCAYTSKTIRWPFGWHSTVKPLNFNFSPLAPFFIHVSLQLQCPAHNIKGMAIVYHCVLASWANLSKMLTYKYAIIRPQDGNNLVCMIAHSFQRS